MDRVRAKFICQSATKVYSTHPDGKFIWNYKFGAVTSGSEENESFWRWTPSGQLELQSIRRDLFEPGQEYYLDFTPVPELVKE